jgi:hypothetical protein
MSRTSAFTLPALAAFVAVGLTACGGGGSGGGGTGGGVPPTSPPTSPPLSVSTPPPNATALSSVIRTDAGKLIGGAGDFSPQRGDTGSGANGPTGSSFDAVPCLPTMPDIAAYHRHVYVGILIQGKQVALPDGIGMMNPGALGSTGFVNSATCFYYIHTHDRSGYVHVEPSGVVSYTLGDFFKVWGQTLSATQVAGFTGNVRVFRAQAPNNSNPTTTGWTEVKTDPHALALTSHMAYMIEVGPTWVEAASLPPVVFYTEF